MAGWGEWVGRGIGGILGTGGGAVIGGVGGAAGGAVLGGAGGAVIGSAGIVTGPGVIITEGGGIAAGAAAGAVVGGGAGALVGGYYGGQAGADAGGSAGRWLDETVAAMTGADDEAKKGEDSAPPTECTGDCAETPSAEELDGKTAEEIDEMLKSKGWKGEATANGQGTRYANPAKTGEQVRVMPNGTPGTSRPDLHDAPYGVVSKGGGKTRFGLR